MPTQASQFDLLTAFLDTPVPIQYGVVRGAGKLVLQEEIADKSRLAAYLLGDGPWDSQLRCWINRLSISVPDTTKVHFHPGNDGVIGDGMAATSTGGDQKVDAFWSSMLSTLSVVGFSRFAYLFVKAAPDPGAPGPELEVLGDYQALKVRIFNSSGVQTSFAWSQNWVWCAVDYLLRKLVLREAKVNQPLTADQVALFDFGLLKAAADYGDVDIGGGVKRFSDGGLVWIQDGLTADRAAEQLLLMCRSFLGERNGKIFIMERKDEASSYTLTLDDIEPGSFVVQEGVAEGAYNRIIPVFRDSGLASGSSDNLTRMAEATPEALNHESHQLATGFAGKGLARMRDSVDLSLDFGVNTAERVWRLSKSLLLETLGDEADPGVTYKPPFRFSVVALEHTVEVVPGDVVTIDRGVSEEWSGTKLRVEKAVERPDGKRELSGRQHNPNAYPDTAPAQQATEAPAPGTGLVPVTGVNSSGQQFVNPTPYHDSAVRELENVTQVGTTAAAAWTTVASFTLELSPLANKYTGKLTVTRSAVTQNGSDGPRSPATAAAAGGSVSITNPNNAKVSDNVYATATLTPGDDTIIDLTNFSFALPANAVPVGMLIESEGVSGGGSGLTYHVIPLKAGTPTGTEKTAVVPTAEAYTSFGANNDLFSGTFAKADIEATGFGARVRVTNDIGFNRTLSLDHVRITVYYATYTMDGRIKIGSLTSNVVSISNPATASAATDVTITGLTPGTSVTVEVQGQLSAGSGTVQVSFAQKRYKDQHKDHFV